MVKERVIVRDPARASDIALEGSAPFPHTGGRDCPECENGLRGSLKGLHHSAGGPKRYEHLPSQERLHDGRLTEQDALGVNVPHPHNAPHHHDAGGLFSAETPNKHPGPPIDADEYDRHMDYYTNAEELGEWYDADHNAELGIGHDDTGLMRDGSVVPLEVGSRQLFGPVKHRIKRDVHDPHLGQRLLWLKSNPKEMQNQAEYRHKMLQEKHPKVLEQMENQRVGKTPCSLCAGHGVVTGNRLLSYLSHRNDAVTGNTDTWWATDMGIEPPIREGEGEIQIEEPSGEVDWSEGQDAEREGANGELRDNSAPWGGQWTEGQEPLEMLDSNRNANFLCVRCRGLGVCAKCGGEGSIVRGDPDMTAEEADQFNDQARAWMDAHDMASTMRGQPLMRPDVRAGATVAGKTGVVQSGYGTPAAPGREEREAQPGFPMGMTGVEAAPSLLQTEEGPGQFQFRPELGVTAPGAVKVAPSRPPPSEFMAPGPRPTTRPPLPAPEWTEPPGITLPQPPPAMEERRGETGVTPPQGVSLPPQEPTEWAADPTQERFGSARALLRADDPRGFALGPLTLTPEGMRQGVSLPHNLPTATPFEHPGGNDLWESWGLQQRRVPNKYRPPKEPKKLGQGLYWSDPDEFREQYRAMKDEAGTKMGDWKEANALATKDVNAGRAKKAKAFLSNIYKMPNHVWHRRSPHDMHSALALFPDLQDTHDRAAASDVSMSENPGDNSLSAERALYQAIRQVHPDWEPRPGSFKQPHMEQEYQKPPAAPASRLSALPEEGISLADPLDYAWAMMQDGTLIH